MLSKILVRSGLSRLLWIKDVVSHRLDDCVLELYGLLCLDLGFKPLLLARCFRASRLRPRRFHSRLSCSNLSRVSRFRLLVNPLASILFSSLLDPRGRRSPLGANRTASKQRRLSRNRTPFGSIYFETSPWRIALQLPISQNNQRSKRERFSRGVCPLIFTAVSWACLWINRNQKALDINHA